jgi:hypothetical protein
MLSTSISEMSKLNASLPPEFLEKSSVMQEDCEAVAGLGKSISVALFEYHADCFRIVRGGANCTLKRALGEPWDHLLDTPFEWSGAGLKSCSSIPNISAPLSYGDFQANTSYKCAVCSGEWDGGRNDAAGSRCATPAMVRLTVCPAEVWWQRATSAAVDTLSMCQSNPHCAFLCYGHEAWNHTRSEVGKKGLLDALRDLSVRRGRQTALFYTVHAIKRVVRSLDEVVEMCGASPTCRDGELAFISSKLVSGGGFDVSQSVCARVYQSESKGGCPDYSRVFRALAEAAPVILEAQYNSTADQFCPARASVAVSACARKLDEYSRMCARTDLRAFCKRQHQFLNLVNYPPPAGAGRIFESCSEPSVGDYMKVVASVNAACKTEESFRPLSGRQIMLKCLLCSEL